MMTSIPLSHTIRDMLKARLENSRERRRVPPGVSLGKCFCQHINRPLMQVDLVLISLLLGVDETRQAAPLLRSFGVVCLVTVQCVLVVFEQVLECVDCHSVIKG